MAGLGCGCRGSVSRKSPSPENLDREISFHFLMHNLVRRLMLEAARRHLVPLERVSFATLTPRALRTENLTAPVFFRLVHQYQPTLLLDEVDSWLPQAEELRGLLNAGHKRGACAYRCEGEGNAVRPFRAFGPAALAGIGQ